MERRSEPCSVPCRFPRHVTRNGKFLFRSGAQHGSARWGHARHRGQHGEGQNATDIGMGVFRQVYNKYRRSVAACWKRSGLLRAGDPLVVWPTIGVPQFGFPRISGDFRTEGVCRNVYRSRITRKPISGATRRKRFARALSLSRPKPEKGADPCR